MLNGSQSLTLKITVYQTLLSKTGIIAQNITPWFLLARNLAPSKENYSFLVQIEKEDLTRV